MKNFLFPLIALFLFVGSLSAQTHLIKKGAFDGSLSLTVEFTDLTGADQDSTTFEDVTSANLQTWGAIFIPLDSDRAQTTDTFTVYLKGFASTLMPGVRIDTFTVVGTAGAPISNATVANMIKTVTPGFDFPYWGLEAVQTNAGTATKTKNRLVCILFSKGFNTGINALTMVQNILKPTGR